MNKTTIGIYVWGAVLIVLSLAVLVPILTGWPAGLYDRVKDCSGALGPIIGAAALAWSWFFRIGGEQKPTDKVSDSE